MCRPPAPPPRGAFLTRAILVPAVVATAAACSSHVARGTDGAARAPARVAELARPRGIVLLLGDGMGAAHFTLARTLRGDRFQIGRMSTLGLVATRSASSHVTDSSAAATAFATGIKTTNGFLGIDPDRRPHPTVLEVAEARGWATGLVTTAKFADATPAAFAAHHHDRKDARALATQIVRSGADLLISTGLELFGTELPPLEELARLGGYQIARTPAELRAATDAPVLAALRSGEHDADPPDASLAVLTRWALDRLARDPEGFFLLVEHEGTDTASHHNATAHLVNAVRSFDAAVGVALDFAARRGDVLVVVAGDHESGGLLVLESPGELGWARQLHTGEAVPIFASGPGAAAFAGFIDNTDVGQALLRFAGGGAAAAPRGR